MRRLSERSGWRRRPRATSFNKAHDPTAAAADAEASTVRFGRGQDLRPASVLLPAPFFRSVYCCFAGFASAAAHSASLLGRAGPIHSDGARLVTRRFVGGALGRAER